MNKLHLMLDIETLSQHPTAAIVQIGACTFDKTGIKDTFIVNIKPESSKEFGMTISSDTIDWWAKQPKEVHDSVFTKGVNADFGLQEFAKWYQGQGPKFVWSQGTTFDFPILEHAMKLTSVEVPWHYWQIMDSRTLFALFGVTTKGLHEKAGSSHHNALEDSKVQAEAVIKILDALGWSEEGSPIKM